MEKGGADMKILAIEESEEELLQLEECLLNNLPNAEIHGFIDGETAWEWSRDNRMDVVFAQFALPNEVIDKTEGAEIASRLYQEGKCKNMILCAKELDDSMKAWNMDASFFYLKPVTNKKIRMGLQKLRYPLSSIDLMGDRTGIVENHLAVGGNDESYGS